MSTEWSGYDEGAQREILAALGEPTQVASTMLRDKLGTEVEMDWDGTAWVLCSAALTEARELIRPGAGEIKAYFRLGFTPVMIAASCRQSADEPQSSPHP